MTDRKALVAMLSEAGRLMDRMLDGRLDGVERMRVLVLLDQIDTVQKEKESVETMTPIDGSAFTALKPYHVFVGHRVAWVAPDHETWKFKRPGPSAMWSVPYDTFEECVEAATAELRQEAHMAPTVR